MMVARLMPVWNSERAATTNVDLNRYQGLEMFSEQAPVVEEDEEKGLEKVSCCFLLACALLLSPFVRAPCTQFCNLSASDCSKAQMERV